MYQGCGGTLVGDIYVITAAHCVDDQDNWVMNPEDLFIRVGDTSLDTKFEAYAFTLGVQRIAMHPNYHPDLHGSGGYDIAVLKLEFPIELNDFPNIKPACLPSAGSKFLGEATVTGWGTVASESYANAWLHEVSVTVFEEGNCGFMSNKMTDDMLCAGHMQGGKDACQGDSGGPLIASDPTKYNAQTLIGVVSFGEECGIQDYPTVYAKVSHVNISSWLEEEMPDLNTCDPYDAFSTTTTTTTTSTTTLPTCGNCVFPFIFDDYPLMNPYGQWTLHYGCTTIDGSKQPWCATKRGEGADWNGNGYYKYGSEQWEYCDHPSCPEISASNTKQMRYHSANAPGKCCK